MSLLMPLTYGASAIWGNPIARRAAMGAGIGAIYGGMTDRGVFGGAWRGAIAGAGVGYGARIAGMPAVKAAGRGLGLGGSARAVGSAMGRAVWSDVRNAGRFMANNARRAYNPIRGLFNR